jgi:uncharacterized membrane protein YebE (DUF533 family)
MSGIFGELLKAGLDMASQDNPSNSYQRGQGGSLLERLGQVVQQNPSNGLNSGSLLDSIGGMLGNQQPQRSGMGGMLGGLLGSLTGGNRNAGLTGGVTGALGQMVGGKKGALIAGALGMLLSSSSGRKMAGKLVKIGGLSAIGMMAYKAYANSKGAGDASAAQFDSNDLNDFGSTIDKLDDSDGMNRRSFAIMKAMIAAAKADGQVDAAEQEAIRAQMDNMGLDDSDLLALRDELTKPLDANDVAASADSPSAAAEMYLVSRLVIDVDSQAERNYIQNLASALSLSPTMVESLDQQISQLG